MACTKKLNNQFFHFDYFLSIASFDFSSFGEEQHKCELLHFTVIASNKAMLKMV